MHVADVLRKRFLQQSTPEFLEYQRVSQLKNMNPHVGRLRASKEQLSVLRWQQVIDNDVDPPAESPKAEQEDPAVRLTVGPLLCLRIWDHLKRKPKEQPLSKSTFCRSASLCVRAEHALTNQQLPKHIGKRRALPKVPTSSGSRRLPRIPCVTSFGLAPSTNSLGSSTIS